MRVGLFIPCYLDQFYPDVALATVELLQAIGVEPFIPAAPTCCGQPMANAGCTWQARPLAEQFIDSFADCDAVVCPSGSCTSMVRHHYHGLVDLHTAKGSVTQRTYELCEFLTDVAQQPLPRVSFPYRVGLHQSCHGLRELGLGAPSELRRTSPQKVEQLLASVEGIEMVPLARRDECCGFGGMFAVAEEAVSVMMGRDRLDDHQAAGAEVMVAADMSCLMHMQGLAQREGRPIEMMHVAQVLAGRQPKLAATKVQA